MQLGRIDVETGPGPVWENGFVAEPESSVPSPDDMGTDSGLVQSSASENSAAAVQEPSGYFMFLCSFFPWMWFAVFIALSSRLAHYLNDRSLMHSELFHQCLFAGPVVFFVIMLCGSSWFRDNWFSVGLIWFVTPLLWFAMGLTQGAFVTWLSDPWIFQK